MVPALGFAAQWIAWRTSLPSILLLLLFGLFLGQFVQPDPFLAELTKGDPNATPYLLFPLVTLSVAVIMFEGGLSLDLRELQGIWQSRVSALHDRGDDHLARCCGCRALHDRVWLAIEHAAGCDLGGHRSDGDWPAASSCSPTTTCRHHSRMGRDCDRSDWSDSGGVGVPSVDARGATQPVRARWRCSWGRPSAGSSPV